MQIVDYKGQGIILPVYANDLTKLVYVYALGDEYENFLNIFP